MGQSLETKENSHKCAIWWVHLPGRKPFTMGGEPITQKEALETVLCIWSTTPKHLIKVTTSL